MVNDASTQDLIRDLTLSVGTHRSSRKLSPLEVANALVVVTNDIGWDAMLDRISLGESTARRLLSLRELDPWVAELIGWGRQPGALSFSVAAEISRIRTEPQQRQLAEESLRHSLTKDEVRQVVQIVERTRRPVDAVVSEILEMRPRTYVIHAVLGAIHSPELSSYLKSLSQGERDQLFDGVLTQIFGSGTVSGRLTTGSFSVVFQGEQSEHVTEEVESSVNDALTLSVRLDS